MTSEYALKKGDIISIEDTKVREVYVVETEGDDLILSLINNGQVTGVELPFVELVKAIIDQDTTVKLKRGELKMDICAVPYRS